MILRIAICDDVQMNITCLTEHIRHYMASYNVQFEIESFTSGEKLLQAQKERPFHILLLDIEMPQINGITIAKYLRDELYDDVFIVFVTSYPEYMQESFEVQPFQFLTKPVTYGTVEKLLSDIFIVFVTSYPEYMQESFEVQPFQFLTKPVTYGTVEKLLSDIIRRYQHSHITKIIVDYYGAEHLIPINDIIYMNTIKSEKRFLEYHLTDTILKGEGTLQDWEIHLENQGFCSPYRGYLINIRHVQIIQAAYILMDNGSHIPVSRRKLTQIQQLYANRIIHVLN